MLQPAGVVKFAEMILSSICLAILYANRNCFLYDVKFRMFGLLVASSFLSITFLIFMVNLITFQHGHKPYLEIFLHGFGAVLFMAVVLWIRVATYPQCFYEYFDIGVSAALNATAYGFDMMLAVRIIYGINSKKPLFCLLAVDGKGNAYPTSDQCEINGNEIA